jgi:hypothetical protein
MTAVLRIFSVSEFISPSDGEPIRSAMLETEKSIIVVWYVRPGQEIAARLPASIYIFKSHNRVSCYQSVRLISLPYNTLMKLDSLSAPNRQFLAN